MGQVARKAMGLGSGKFVARSIPQMIWFEESAELEPRFEKRLITAMRKLDPDLAAMLENLI